MSKVLVIGAGGVGSVCVHKMAMMGAPFDEIVLASRTKIKCDEVAASVAARTGKQITTAQVDGDDAKAVAKLIEKIGADLVVHLALPYQDLTIMDACLMAGADYLDTANYEPRDCAKFEYHWQWAYQERFEKAGLMALLGAGFDPGVTNVFTTYTAKHFIDEMDTLDILDCNGGDHGHPFATNFNPEINIREITAAARHYEKGVWVETPALSQSHSFDFPEVGVRNMYLMYHEELESLTKHFPQLQQARFWMTFGDAYLTHLEVLQNVGLTSIAPINYQGQEIVPLQFLQAVLPDPSTLGQTTKGKTCIGTIISGTHKNKPRHVYIYNVCDHEVCFAEIGGQAVSYTTGVPAAIGASLMLEKIWHKAGVFNIEQFDPDPFMDRLNQNGLPWQMADLATALSF